MKTKCWISPLRKDKDGYPRMKYDGRSQPAARILMRIIHGNKIDGRLVLHRCDNPSCVRPEHLYIGTFLQNMADKKNRRRVAGENHPNSKLTDAQCDKIRKLYASGNYYQWELGEMYNVPQSVISSITTGKRRKAT